MHPATNAVIPGELYPWGRARSEPKWAWRRVNGYAGEVRVCGTTVHPEDVRLKKIQPLKTIKVNHVQPAQE